jgi:glycosyltransferase involved in cell wall biosynthesis
MPANAVELSVVMPCLNEEESVPWCVERAWLGIERTDLRGQVVVCDNGSADRSVELARQAGARVIEEPRRGYGRAYLTGIEAAVGGMIVIGDSDCSYDFSELYRLIGPLLEGYDYVLGSRFAGTILPGAMPALNRYLGNPLLTAMLNSLFGLNTSDAHSGMRAFTRSAYQRMALRCEGMEFASEIVIAAARAGLRFTEVPITYHPRMGRSKLRRFRDGSRHVRFMLAEATAPQVVLPAPPETAYAPRPELAQK